MFNIVLYQPEIPPNTGNIIRLCANTGSTLHLIHPLGFQLEDKQLRRAGLDYHDLACVREHHSMEQFLTEVQPRRIYACSTRGKRRHADVDYQTGDTLLFGPETRGLPQSMLDQMPQDRLICIPMKPGNRSLNLANAVTVILYEAWRQLEFAGSRQA